MHGLHGHNGKFFLELNESILYVQGPYLPTIMSLLILALSSKRLHDTNMTKWQFVSKAAKYTSLKEILFQEIFALDSDIEL